jgi:hypothetical protein
MTRGDSEWVNGLFATSAGDWTPAPASYAARVLYAPVSRDPEASRRCASVLSDIELQRADRFVTEDGKAHFRQRRAFRRYCGAFLLGSPQPLSRIVFQETEKGRPYLPDLPNVWFSFSSCRFGFSARGRRHTGSVLTSKIKRGTWRRQNSLNNSFRKLR